MQSAFTWRAVPIMELASCRRSCSVIDAGSPAFPAYCARRSTAAGLNGSPRAESDAFTRAALAQACFTGRCDGSNQCAGRRADDSALT